MLSAENMRRSSSCQCSSCSSSTVTTSRSIAASLGKMPSLQVRRLITALLSAPRCATLKRSSRLVHQTFFQRWEGKWRKARMSSLAFRHPPSRLGEFGGEHGVHLIPLLKARFFALLRKHRAQGSGHHLLGGFRHRLEQVP